MGRLCFVTVSYVESSVFRNPVRGYDSTGGSQKAGGVGDTIGGEGPGPESMHMYILIYIYVFFVYSIYLFVCK